MAIPNALPSRPSRGAWIETASNCPRRRNGRSRPSRGAWIETPKRTLGMAPETPSRPSRGAWIETPSQPSAGAGATSRPSRGAWIETACAQLHGPPRASRPSRGAWIETVPKLARSLRRWGRALHGARGLKPTFGDVVKPLPSRALHGARGLKHRRPARGTLRRSVAPFTGRVD